MVHWSEPRTQPAESDLPLRGADSINDGELEIGFDESFERRFRLVSYGGRVILVLVVAAGLLGLLGRGPYSHRRLESPDHQMWIDFEPVARWDTETQVTVHCPKPAPGQTTMRLWVSSHFMEPMGLKTIQPQPASSTADGGGEILAFPVQPVETSLIRLQLKPSAVGPVPLQARLNDGAVMHWTQWVLP